MDKKTRDESLFYEATLSSGGIIIVNKRQIESAKMQGNINVLLKMVTGETLTLGMDANAFGDLTYQLLLVKHTSE